MNPNLLTVEDLPARCKDLYELEAIIDRFIATESSDEFLKYFAHTRQIEYALGYFAAIADCDNKMDLAAACRDHVSKYKEYIRTQLGRNDFYKFWSSMRRVGHQTYYDVLSLSVSYGGRLNESDKNKFTELRRELDGLCSQFMKNVAAYQQSPDSIYIKIHDTDEVSEAIDWFKTFDIDITHSYAIPLTGPNIAKLMTLNSQTIRIQTFTHAAARCQKSNEPVLRKIVKCRCQIASLLGYNSYNDLISNQRGHYNNAATAMTEIRTQTKLEYDHATSDFTEFIARLPHNHPSFINEYRSSDVFPIDKMTEIAENIFGIKIWSQCANESLTKPQYYFINAGEGIGSVYFDLFARPGKVSQNMTYVGNYTDKVMAVTMNIHINNPNNIVTYDDMQEFIHEIGHCLHIMAAKVVPFNCAFDCGRDIIEIPAMYAEAKFELEHPRSSCINQEVMTAMTQRQQYVLSEFDRKIHDFGPDTDFDGLDLKQIWLDIETDTGVCAFAPCKPLFMFHHLAQEYAGWYYGYQFSRRLGRFQAVNEAGEKGPILEIIRDMMNIRW